VGQAKTKGAELGTVDTSPFGPEDDVNKLTFALGIVTCTVLIVRPLPAQDQSNALETSEFVLAADLGRQVEEALKTASETGLGGLQLSEATLSIETGVSHESSVELHFIIFTISHRKQKGTTQMMSLLLRAPESRGLVKKIKLPDVKDALARAIATAAAMASSINVLPLDEAKVKFDFATSRNTKGEIEYVLLTGNASSSIDFSKTSKNSLEVVFKHE